MYNKETLELLMQIEINSREIEKEMEKASKKQELLLSPIVLENVRKDLNLSTIDEVVNYLRENTFPSRKTTIH